MSDFSPLADGELEKLRQTSSAETCEGGLPGVRRHVLRVALNRALDLLERTIDERDRQTAKAVTLLTEKTKLKAVALEALDLLQDREWQTEGGDIYPHQNFCDACHASADMPSLPLHEPDCRWAETVKTLRELTS